jgi:hypothetical protein
MTVRGSVAVVVAVVVEVGVALIAATPASAQQPVAAGRIKVVAGAVSLMHDGRPTPATVGALVYEQDSLTTGPDGRVGLTLRDETRLSIGPGSAIEISRFLYAPADSQYAFALKVIRGVVAYVSGRIAKLSPDAVRLETPSAIVGVRGTRLTIRVGR